ncbi:hypothetical protein HIM_00904 [Hirsutella minnesotensis 3608]|nr:hypothetical protein HIM_00904 [Hirsutella minnesotensis 3608]
MGIPHLTATLQPYADHRVVQDEAVVIDGPALAYHVLHICRVNGRIHPSYRLVGQSTVAWLDELAKRRVVVNAIFFDGHLPESKLAVRMERMMRNTAQIARLYANNPRGCPRSYMANQYLKGSLDLFKVGVPETRPAADPSFFVPAVIEALRLHPKYQDLVSVVPGEADAFCAGHASKHGGLVLTSDSDLLVHDLGPGEVAFFRDIHRDLDSKIVAACFAPRQICQRIGLSLDADLCRFAYEQRRAPHAALSQMVRACSKPPSELSEFDSFCEEYRHQGGGTSPSLGSLPCSQLEALDPRISEVVVQLLSLASMENSQRNDCKMFLPILLEDCDRGTAWEPSTPLRQLAYSLLGMRFSSHEIPVLEYRRVQSTGQKGRRIEALSAAEVESVIDGILRIMNRVKLLTRARANLYWPLVALVLNISECQRQGKQSHVWSVLAQHHRPSLTQGSNIYWDIVHFYAHLQASMYSIRILCQVRPLHNEAGVKASRPYNTEDLWRETADFPLLAEFPNLEAVVDLLLWVSQHGIIQPLSQFFNIANPALHELGQTSKHSRSVAKKRSADNRKHSGPLEQVGNVENAKRTNMFDLLSVD